MLAREQKQLFKSNINKYTTNYTEMVTPYSLIRFNFVLIQTGYEGEEGVDGGEVEKEKYDHVDS